MNFIQQGYQQVANKLEETYQQAKDTILPWHDVQSVMITQKDDFLECCLPCLCEGVNNYTITQIDMQGNPQQQLATLSETSSCPSRFCCQCFRPFQMRLSIDKFADQEIFAEKPCGCTMTPAMCCNANCYLVFLNGIPACRPLITVNSKTSIIGRVSNPFRICGRSGVACCPFDEIDILDGNGNLKYIVSASCVQLGQCCRLACCICRCCVGNKIEWVIMDSSKQILGKITNVYNGCWKETCTKEDKFTINFPSNANYNEKILLIYAAIMIDFDIFEDTCCHLA